MTVKNPFTAFGTVKKSEPDKKIIAFPTSNAEEAVPKPVEAEVKKQEEAPVDVTETAQPAAEPEKEPEKPAKKEAKEIDPEKLAEAAKKVISANIIPVSFKAKSITLQDIADKFAVIDSDEKWSAWEKDMRERIDRIEIKRDINMGSARILQELITNTYPLLERARAQLNSQQDVFIDKTVGLIPRFSALNGNIGKNETERKRNIALAFEAFPIGKYKLNIADYTLAVTQRNRIIEELYNNLKHKETALFTYIAIMKMENAIKN